MEYGDQSARQFHGASAEDIISWVCSRDGHQVLCVCQHNGSELFKQSRSAAKACLRFEQRLEDYFCDLGNEAEEWPQDLVDSIRKGHASLCRLTDGDFPDLSAVGLGSTKEKRARSVAVALLITACISDEHLAGIPEGGSLDDLATGLESVCAKARAIFPADGERCGAPQPPQAHPQAPRRPRERPREYEDAQPAPSHDFPSSGSAYRPRMDEAPTAEPVQPEMLWKENRRLEGCVKEEHRLRQRLEEKLRILSHELAESDREAAKLERELARKDGELARKDRELAQTERRLYLAEDDNRRLRQHLDNSQREHFEDRRCSGSAMRQSDEDFRGARPWKSQFSRCKRDLGGDAADADAEDGAREEQEELADSASGRSRSPFEEASESRRAHPSAQRRAHPVQWHPRPRTSRRSEHLSGLYSDRQRRQ